MMLPMMKIYKVKVTSLGTPATPYIPDIMLKHMDMWKIIANALYECGFYHLGDCMVMGNDENVIEFHLTFNYDRNVFNIELDTMVSE